MFTTNVTSFHWDRFSFVRCWEHVGHGSGGFPVEETCCILSLWSKSTQYSTWSLYYEAGFELIWITSGLTLSCRYYEGSSLLIGVHHHGNLFSWPNVLRSRPCSKSTGMKLLLTDSQFTGKQCHHSWKMPQASVQRWLLKMLRTLHVFCEHPRS